MFQPKNSRQFWSNLTHGGEEIQMKWLHSWGLHPEFQPAATCGVLASYRLSASSNCELHIYMALQVRHRLSLIL